MAFEMTDADAERLSDTVKKLEALCTLASANLPDDTKIRIETVGSSPAASLVLAEYDVWLLINLGRSALSKVQP